MSRAVTVRGAMVGRIPCPVCGHLETVLAMVKAVVRKTTFKVWSDGLVALPRCCAECQADVPFDRYPDMRFDSQTQAGIEAARAAFKAAA